MPAVRHAWIALVLVGCGGAAHASVRDVALAPAEVTEPEGLRVAAVTIGPEGRSTPFGVSGGDPIAALEGPTLDPTYGFTPENPARVGGFGDEDPESGEKSFLHALWGPEGQPVYFERIGSCCPIEPFGMLDAFAVTYPGLEGEPLVLYLDAYHRAPLHVPMGLRGAPATIDATASR